VFKLIILKLVPYNLYRNLIVAGFFKTISLIKVGIAFYVAAVFDLFIFDWPSLIEGLLND